MPKSRRQSPSDLPNRVLETRVAALFRHMPKALAGDEESVHQLRVAGRRLRVALPLVAMRPDGRRVRRAQKGLRDIVRTAGATRDLDVGLELLETLLDSPPSPESRQVRGRLRSVRARGRAALVRAFLDEDLPALRRSLRRLAGRGDTIAHAQARTRAALLEQGRQTRADVLALDRRFDPPALHALRRRLRKLRYVAETAEALGAATADSVGLLKQQQSLLGEVQDAHVLAERLDGVASRCEARGKDVLAREARRLEELLRGRSRSHHLTWLESEPLACLDRALAPLSPRQPEAGSPEAPIACGAG